MHPTLANLAATGTELSDGQLDDAAGGLLPLLYGVAFVCGVVTGYALGQ